jgi:glucose/arabinose dehydrogenase
MFRYVLLLLLCPCCVYAQRDAKIPDPDPELERKTFIVDPRFEVNLYAADPLLAKPIQMNFDAAGRLWIASSEVYPQIKPGQKANDKIIILEDTKGVGVADKTTVFADGLLIPTGLLPGDGGCYVANSTELLHFSDTNGDGKADKKRIVLSGFGTEDTHHMLHTLRWGPDGRMYMMQSIYIHSHIETPHGPRRLNAGGIWRFKPQTMELDVFARGWVNPWGLAFDRYGQAFVTDGAGGEGINYVIPGGYYVTAADAKRIFPGLNPGSPKFCGLEVTSGRHLPDDWQGNLLTNDFRGHRVCRFILKDDGAGFASIEQPELIKSTHPAFRPIDVKMGPDGAIYIADWYNPIIQHGEVDFRDPRRDVTHGRIWRVTAKGRPLVKKPSIEGASTKDLLEALKQPEQWTRDMARLNVIKRNDQGVVEFFKTYKAELDELAQYTCLLWTDEGAKEQSRIHYETAVLWQLLQHRLSDADRKSLYSPWYYLLPPVLADKPKAGDSAYFYHLPDDVVSKWELGRMPIEPKDGMNMHQFAFFINHKSQKVRLGAIRAVARLPRAEAVPIALQALNHSMDRFLDYALWLTVRELEPQWLPAFRAGKLKFDDPKHLLFAVQASGSPELVEPLLAYLQQNDLKGRQLMHCGTR